MNKLLHTLFSLRSQSSLFIYLFVFFSHFFLFWWNAQSCLPPKHCLFTFKSMMRWWKVPKMNSRHHRRNAAVIIQNGIYFCFILSAFFRSFLHIQFFFFIYEFQSNKLREHNGFIIFFSLFTVEILRRF